MRLSCAAAMILKAYTSQCINDPKMGGKGEKWPTIIQSNKRRENGNNVLQWQNMVIIANIAEKVVQIDKRIEETIFFKFQIVGCIQIHQRDKNLL